MCAGARGSRVMRVIIWLNGTFGVGKTSTAQRLAAMVPDSRVFDPEAVGQMLRGVLVDRPVGDFQDWAAWRSLVAAALTEIARMTGQHIVVPQTVLRREYFDQIFAQLRAAELDVYHVVLDAADAVLRNRIETSDEAREWRLTHLDEYQDARPWMTEAADYVVDTAASTPPQIARRIFSALPDMPAPAAAAPPPGRPAASAASAAAQTAAAQTAAAQAVAAQTVGAAAPPKPKLSAGSEPAAKPALEDQAKAGVRVSGHPGLADHR
jgi:chloramphenicol 3-O-phosphotransferase